MAAVNFVFPLRPLGLLLAEVTVGAATYLALCQTARVEAFTELKRLIRQGLAGQAGLGWLAKSA